MPTSGAHPGRLAEVAISDAATEDYEEATYVDIEKVRSPSLSGDVRVADTSNNDDDGEESHIIVWSSGTLSFDVVADWNAPGQDHLLDAHEDSEVRAWRYCPRGHVEGEPQWRFLGTVSFTNSNDDAGRFRVHVKRTGSFTRDVVATIPVIVEGAEFIFDPNDASSLTLSGSEVTVAANAGGAASPSVSLGPGSQSSAGPTLVDGEVNGQDVARFSVNGSRVSLSDLNIVTANPLHGVGAMFGNQLSTKTVYLVARFDTIATAALGYTQQDCVISWNITGNHRFAICVRRDGTSGAYSAVAHVYDTAMRSVEAPISLSTWHVVAIRHGAGTLEISVDGGAWQTVAAGAQDSYCTHVTHSFGYARYYAKGMDADVAYFSTYAARHSDAEVEQNVGFLMHRFALGEYEDASGTVFSFTGADQSIVVPSGKTEAHVTMWGAGGSGGGYASGVRGGAGGFTTARFAVTPGDTLTIKVGGGGSIAVPGAPNGGGWPNGGHAVYGNDTSPGGGGGRSQVALNGTIMAIAGGGGGASGWAGGGHAGAGGGLTGAAATVATGGSGGTQSAGGVDLSAPSSVPKQGTSLAGGYGSASATSPTTDDGGAGGDGWFGGGGGGGDARHGGGGSGYVNALCISGTTTQGTMDGTGLPANTNSALYDAGVGVGSNSSTMGGVSQGGDGRVVVRFS